MINISRLDFVMIYWIWWIQPNSFWENSNITKLIAFFLDLFTMPRDVSSKRFIVFGCNEAIMSIHVSPVMKTWRIQRYLKNNMGKQTKNIDIYSFCYVRLDICFWKIYQNNLASFCGTLRQCLSSTFSFKRWSGWSFIHCTHLYDTCQFLRLQPFIVVIFGRAEIFVLYETNCIRKQKVLWTAFLSYMHIHFVVVPQNYGLWRSKSD